jgi:O-antigen/teichoic acid export membrane protein
MSVSVAVTAPSSRSLARGGLLVAVGLAAANIVTYAFSLLMSRRLGPVAFGELAAVLGAVVVGSVPSMALQAVIARRTAVVVSTPSARSPLAAALPMGRRVGIGSLVVGLVVAVPLALLLDLPGPGATVWGAVLLGPFALVCTAQGVLQGEQRFGRLATVFVAVSVLRFGGGIVGLALGNSPSWVMAGSAIGMALGSVAALALTRDGRDWSGADPEHLLSGVARELTQVCAAVGGLLVLANLDLILARVTLAHTQAGVYAVGALATKAIYWMTQFIPTTAFARFTDPAQRARLLPKAMALVAALGALAVLVAAVLGGQVLDALVGGAYAELAPELWRFALLGTLLALVQVQVSSRIAGNDRRAFGWVWVAAVVELLVIVVWANTSIAAVVTAACVVVGLLVIAELVSNRLR